MGAKRAQSGLEYLVTYGWAIFILVIVIAVLWYMGAFNGISFAGSGISSSGFSSFRHIDSKVNNTGAVVVLANSVTRSITINSITVGVTDETADSACTYSPLAVSANGILTVTCSSVPQGVINYPGSRYDLTVTIDFTDGTSGGNHIDIGFFGGKVGTS